MRKKSYQGTLNPFIINSKLLDEIVVPFDDEFGYHSHIKIDGNNLSPTQTNLLKTYKSEELVTIANHSEQFKYPEDIGFTRNEKGDIVIDKYYYTLDELRKVKKSQDKPKDKPESRQNVSVPSSAPSVSVPSVPLAPSAASGASVSSLVQPVDKLQSQQSEPGMIGGNYYYKKYMKYKTKYLSIKNNNLPYV